MGDKLINPIVGVYIPIIRIPIKGGMTIPNIATLDHGTCGKWRFSLGIPTYWLWKTPPLQDINLDEARELVDEERDRDLPGVFFWGRGPARRGWFFGGFST